MLIGELSNALGVTREALRFYEREGLLQSTRGANGYRHYTPQSVAWLTYVRQAQALGFSLAEIRADMALLDAGHAAEAQIREALSRKLAQLASRITVLEDMRASLQRRLDDPNACALQENLRRTRVRGTGEWSAFT